MKKCSYCGLENPDEASKCQTCHTDVDASETMSAPLNLMTLKSLLPHFLSYAMIKHVAIIVLALLLAASTYHFGYKIGARNGFNNGNAWSEGARRLLQPLLQNGDSMTNIIAKFGPPFEHSQAPLSEYGDVLVLSFRFPDSNNAAYCASVSGFTGYFITSNKQLTYWRPFYER